MVLIMVYGLNLAFDPSTDPIGDAFRRYGHVTNVQYAGVNTTKVYMSKLGDAAKAVAGLDGTLLHGHIIVVRLY